MKTKISPAAVGMFILGALLIFLVGFLTFGGSNIFVKPARFMIYFDESVSGLDPGAPIKINGVRIGRVAAINVRYDAITRAALVQTVCEINKNILTDNEGKMIDLTSAEELNKLIDRGLRARLNFTGITGLLFVELDFEDPKAYPASQRAVQTALPVVPAIPSPIAQVQQSIIEIVANLKKVDFSALAKDVRTLLASTNQKVNELDLKALNDRLTGAAEAVTGFVNSADAKAAFANLNRTLDAARSAMAKIDGQVGPVGDDLRQTLAEAQSALKALSSAAQVTRNFVQAQGQVGDEVTDSLRQVAHAAAALERLATTLERNPSSLIVGKKKINLSQP